MHALEHAGCGEQDKHLIGTAEGSAGGAIHCLLIGFLLKQLVSLFFVFGPLGLNMVMSSLSQHLSSLTMSIDACVLLSVVSSPPLTCSAGEVFLWSGM